MNQELQALHRMLHGMFKLLDKYDPARRYRELRDAHLDAFYVATQLVVANRAYTQHPDLDDQCDAYAGLPVEWWR